MKYPPLNLSLRVLFLAALYVLGGFLGRQMVGLTGSVWLVWPPAGLALAGVLIFGRRCWPSLVLGALLFSWLAGVPFGCFMLGTAAGSILGALVCAFLLRHFTGFENALERPRAVLAYLLVVGSVGTTVNAAFNVAGLCYDHKVFPATLLPAFTAWWLANALALLLVAPVILVWATPTLARLNSRRWLEVVGGAAGLVVATLISFGIWRGHNFQEYPLASLPCLFLAWSAWRFGLRGATLGTLTVAVLAILSIWLKRGPFFTPDLDDSLCSISGYLVMVAAANLLLAAAAGERRRKFLAALAYEKRLQLVLADQTDLICRFQPDGRLTFVNHICCEFYAQPEAALLGANFFEKFVAGDSTALREKLSELSEARSVLIFDRRAVRADGHFEWQQHTIRRIGYEHSADFEFQAIIQNINARKLAELALQDAQRALQKLNAKLQAAVSEARTAAAQAGQANLAKSEFLANMSHEIRTPIGGLLGMVELLAQTRLDAHQRELARAAAENANALLHVINDVLNYSKIEAGKLPATHVKFSLQQVVDDVLEEVAAHEPDKKISLAAIIHRTVPAQLAGDPVRLRQVLLNLVSNGLKFTAHGEVIVRVQPVSHAPGHTLLRFEVNDTGLGLTEVQTQELFQPFVQADNSSSRKFGGTGLGLAIARKIIELMDGRIGVQSAAGAGSTFWFELPFAVPAQPALVRQFPGLVFLQVIIAAPNAGVRESLAQRLRNWGVNCCEVASVNELAHVLEHELRAAVLPLVLCDDEMLELGGGELRRHLAVHRGQMQSLLLAGSVTATKGADDDLVLFASVLLKPVREGALFDALVAVVTGKMSGAPRPAGQPGHTEIFRRSSAVVQPTAISGLRILAAEDHPFNRRLCQLMLDSFGAHADWAVNGLEAVEKFSAGTYDAILMDCNMPEMDGYETTAAIRHLEVERAAAPRVRIIAVTANALAGERERCLAAGMDDYISKPFNSQQLYHVLLAAAPPPTTGAEIFDPTYLDQLGQEMGPSAAIEIVTDFLHELPERLAAIRRLPATAEWPELRRSAHSLGELLQQFGLTPPAETCQALKAAASQADAGQVAALMVELDTRMESAIARLRHWLDQQKLPAA